MAGKKAFGSILSKGTTAIGGLTNIGGPNISADTIDITSNDSVDAWREFIGGLKNGGQVTLEGNFENNEGQAALVSGIGADPEQYEIKFPAFTPAVTWAFSAIVVAFNVTAPMDGKLGFSATLQISGKPTLGTAGA